MPNTVTYEAPVSGTVAPTAAQSKNKNTVSAVVTGDGVVTSTSIVITHNWGLTAAQLAQGFPQVVVENLLVGGQAGNPIVAAKAANSVTLTVVAFTGAALRVRLQRPMSLTV